MTGRGAAAKRAAVPPPPHEPLDTPRKREAWIKRTRRLVCPPAMLLPDGDIDQRFFRPDRVLLLSSRRWTEHDTELLLQGIADRGVGDWAGISKAVLPGWEPRCLQARAAQLLGCDDLAQLHGWRATRADVEAFRERRRFGTSAGVGDAAAAGALAADVPTCSLHGALGAGGASPMAVERPRSSVAAGAAEFAGCD